MKKLDQRRPIKRRSAWKGINLEQVSTAIDPYQLRDGRNLRPRGGDLVPRGGQQKVYSGAMTGRVVGVFDTEAGGDGKFGFAGVAEGNNLFGVTNPEAVAASGYASVGNRLWFLGARFVAGSVNERYLFYYAPDQSPTVQRYPTVLSSFYSPNGKPFNAAPGLFVDYARNMIGVYGVPNDLDAGCVVLAVPIPQPQNACIAPTVDFTVGETDQLGYGDSIAQIYVDGDYYYILVKRVFTSATVSLSRLYRYHVPTRALTLLSTVTNNNASTGQQGFTHSICKYREYIYWLTSHYDTVSVGYVHTLIRVSPDGTATNITSSLPADVARISGSPSHIRVVNDIMLIFAEGYLTSVGAGAALISFIIKFTGSAWSVLWNDAASPAAPSPFTSASEPMYDDAVGAQVVLFTWDGGSLVTRSKTIGYTDGTTVVVSEENFDPYYPAWVAGHRSVAVVGINGASSTVSITAPRLKIGTKNRGATGTFTDLPLDVRDGTIGDTERYAYSPNRVVG